MTQETNAVRTPPKGLAVLAVIGPSFIWCAEYIGSGEVIIATRTGSILGTTVIWAVVLGIFLKYWIGMSGARILLSLAYAMRARGLALGLATLCISGGQGLAVVLERV